MKRKKIIKAIIARLQYLETVSGFPASKVKSTNELIETFYEGAETIAQFKDCSYEEYDELQMLIVEMCSDLIYMSSVFEKSSDRIRAVIKDSLSFPIIKPINEVPFAKVNDAFVKFGDRLKSVQDTNLPLPKRVGRISDGRLVNDEMSKLTLNQKLLIRDIAQQDPACQNGLIRLIVEFEREDIVQFMSDIGIKGRAMALGFLAKLCRYDIARADAVMAAYNDGFISVYNIKSTCLNGDSSGFNVKHVMEEYGK